MLVTDEGRAACVLLSQKLEVNLPNHLLTATTRIIDPIEEMYRAGHNVGVLARLCHGRRYISSKPIANVRDADLLSEVAVAIFILQDELHTSNVLLFGRNILDMLVKDEKAIIWFEIGKDLSVLRIGGRIDNLS